MLDQLVLILSTKKQVVHVRLSTGELQGPAFEMLYLGLLFKTI